MRIANRHFKPTLAGTLSTLLLLPLLISLGFWQLSRAAEKRALLAEFQMGAATTQQLGGDNIESLSFLQQVIAQGSYDSAHQVLLDNMPAPLSATRQSPPGYQVLTPLVFSDGHIVLVNRGWVPLGSTRKELPDIVAPIDNRSVRGRISDLPRPGFRMGSASIGGDAWPRLLNFPTMADLRNLYGGKLLSKIILLDPKEPDGFVRDWSARYSFGAFGPERHVAYAVQWFALSFTLCVLYVVVNFKRIP